MNSGADHASEIMDTRYAAALVNLVVERGYDPARVLACAGIDFDPLDRSAAGYRDEISAEQYTQLYQQVLEFLQDQIFGVSSRRMVTPGAFRMLCYAIIHCDTLGSALHRANHFFQIFFNLAVRVSVIAEDEEAVVGYSRFYERDEAESEATVRQPTASMEASALAMWHRFCVWLTGRALPLRRVQLQGECGAAGKFEQMFGCPVQCGKASTAMVFDAALLERALVQTEQSLKEFLRTAPYQLMAAPMTAQNSLVSQVQGIIGRDFSRGFPCFERVAEGLNMSAPTLRRRLKREGATYQELKDSCRRDAAVVYLNRPDLSISEVAALMGFTEPSAFHRSFKKWTGVPPGEYRRRLTAGSYQADADADAEDRAEPMVS